MILDTNALSALFGGGAGEGIARVFYCTVVDRRIVMLHHFVKKSQKTPRKELDIARRRMKEVKDG